MEDSEIRVIKDEAYNRAIEACELFETNREVIEELKNIMRAPHIYE